MQEVGKQLFVGNQEDTELEDYSVVHAAKSFHQKVLGYAKSLPGDHEHYLVYAEPGNIYLNLVDMPREFMPKFTDPIFEAALAFIIIEIGNGKNVLLRCNVGKSRSPSLALFYLARTGQIDSISYESARADFVEIYPEYEPGEGIRLYMENNWAKLMEM